MHLRVMRFRGGIRLLTGRWRMVEATANSELRTDCNTVEYPLMEVLDI